jgi:NADH-quinone oxidoreductase subunit M/multicomponent Na+:H+ antiporter subunit D
MLIVGFGLQAGMVPFHTWLPDAHMAAPNAVSAVLSGIMVKTGIYGLCTALLVIFTPMRQFWQTPLAAFAILTMFIGNLSALTQDDIKRLLAFSTIANTGYILLGLSIASQAALTGSLLHILNHAITKTLLFLCAGTFIHRTQTRSLKELAGLPRSMPIISAMFLIGALSLTGIPPLNTFWGEFLIILASLEAGLPFLAFLMLINIIFSGAYCLRLIQLVTRKKQTPALAKNQTSIFMLIPIVILGLLCIFIGLFPLPFQNFAETAAQALLNP